jgi:hypothetical protein
MKKNISEITIRFLDYNTGCDKPMTISTFLNKYLHGRAKDYASDYARKMIIDLTELEARGDVIKTTSARGKLTWVWAEGRGI